MRSRVAMLGPGKMGSALARRLAETGVEMMLWNRTRSRAEEVGGGQVVNTPADAVAQLQAERTKAQGSQDGSR
jgi:3-hydroxyisobutyrate dehydrogenase-like beta-hydroxyacid dehydrogenase